jgi:peptidyl-prolyl cis-trans isomerase SurA
VRPPRLALPVLVVLLAGCAMPGWVPFFGKGGSDPQSARMVPPPEQPAEPAAPSRAEIDDLVLDRVVAVVNNDAITLGELQESVAMYRQENRGRAMASDEELSRQFLGRLIDVRLQLQEAERERIVVEEAEINDELHERLKRFGATNMDELEAMVKAQGLTMDSVRKRVRDSLRVAKVIRRKVALRVSVTEPEVDRYLAENRDKLETGLKYHAWHILVTPSGGSDAAWEAARLRAEGLRTQIQQGADFAEVARQHSRDASARTGGDLGTLKRGELAQDVEATILALNPGEVSMPHRSSLGFHIFKLESKEVLEGEGLQRLRQQVREILYRQKYEARLEAWIKEIKQRAIIQVRM